MPATAKKDNSTARRNVGLRLALLRELEARGTAPIVMETHGGWGYLGRHCYAEAEAGVVFEKDPLRAAKLAMARPTWAVYECDCAVGLMAGAGATFDVTFLDVDPYGEPWPALEAFFASERPRPSVLAVAVNDGLRQKLRQGGGWNVASMAAVARQYGNAALHDSYLEICRELLESKAARAGYRLDRWTGYYTGHLDEMTHYGAIFTGGVS